MKVVTAALIMLLIICIFIGIHAYIMSELSSDISAICAKTEKYASEEKWQDVKNGLIDSKKIWDKSRIWCALTISTNEIDKIEIALRRSMDFADLKAKPDFFGEFTTFRTLIERIPKKEGFHLEEVL